MSNSLTLHVHEEDGSLWAEVAELPGCFASGEDMNELMEAVQEAVTLYLEDNPEAQKILAQVAAPEPKGAVVTPLASRRGRPTVKPRLRVDDIRASVQYDELIEA